MPLILLLLVMLASPLATAPNEDKFCDELGRKLGHAITNRRTPKDDQKLSPALHQYLVSAFKHPRATPATVGNFRQKFNLDGEHLACYLEFMEQHLASKSKDLPRSSPRGRHRVVY